MVYVTDKMIEPAVVIPDHDKFVCCLYTCGLLHTHG